MQTDLSCIGMRRFPLAASVPGALIALLAFSQAGCGPKTAESKPAEASVQAGLFSVPRDQLSHLQVTQVARVSWNVDVHTTGTVDWDQDHTTQAITQVNGPISRILVDVGRR